MILNERFKAPIISFGLGMTVLSCELGDEVNIWQNEIYNSNEYFLQQEEVSEVINLVYSSIVDPEVNLNIDYFYQGIYEGRPYYFNSGGLGANTFIFWDTSKWMIVSNFNPMDGTFVQEVGRCLLDIPTPVTNQWLVGGVNFIPKTTTSNINKQGFKFNAAETKLIQVAIVNKTTGHIAKSNKIQLIVNES